MHVFRHFYFILLLLIFTKVQPSNQPRDLTRSPALNMLLEDMRHYKLTDSTLHSGNLFEHSVWTEHAISNWCAQHKKSCWCDNLSKRDYYLAAIAGLLHDVGKAGDQVFLYVCKPEHPKTGFQYLLGDKTYQSKNGTWFSFETIFKELGLKPEEQKIITVLVGMHWDFGSRVVKAISMGQKHDVAFSRFLGKLQDLCQKAEYNKGHVNERIIRLAVLVSAGDVKGLQPNTTHKSLVFRHNIDCVPVFDMPDAYVKFDFERKGKATSKALLRFFRKNKHNIKNIGNHENLSARSWGPMGRLCHC